ncbi:MAG: AbrB/MazE/SpoVT family DNA-binding domain-containing protein [Thaumarchaeota archaeon]|nr:AbrB/MazE/SpoVT family DNA-binding domain-containing protein [Nitrososphaerota archaeon]
MVHRSVIGPKGQVTIPKELREKYHLLEGEEVIVLPVSEGVMLKHPRVTLRGKFKGHIDIEGLEKDVQKLRRQWRT